MRVGIRDIRKYLLLALAVLAPIAAASAESTTTAPAATQPAAQMPQMAVYRWGIHPDRTEQFAAWVGYKPQIWGEDFQANDSWDNIENAGWQNWPWGRWVAKGHDRRLILSVTLLPGPWTGSGPTQGHIDAKKPVSLEAGARGEYNHHFQVLAENLIADHLGNSILRLGWEFNGGWYTWRAAGKADAFARYWQQIVTTMRAVKGADFKFDWNPAIGWQQFPAETAWPGDDYVDYVGLDVYDDSWLADTYPFPPKATDQEIAQRRARAWQGWCYSGNRGLLFWSKFAAEHHKPFSIPEWGVDHRADGHGGLDDPQFVQNLYDFIVDPANHVAFHCYFDVNAGDGAHQLSPGESGKDKTQFPLSAAKFKSLFATSDDAATRP